MIHFTINGEKFDSPKNQVSVEWLLELVGLKSADVELIRETTGEVWTKPSEIVKLHEGDVFTAKHRGGPPKPEPEIHYAVNGEPQVTTESPLTVEEILRRAGAGAAIDLNQLASYYLDNVRSGVRYENPGDEVPIADGDQFVALHAGPTPVA
ncbi:MAG: hypothetical protein F4X59_18085 [Holophagales bacterium]|nr:hypothetical protein [Holophagales bacterium]MYC12016.1 hypothetical protein [Holophagales bacterium]